MRKKESLSCRWWLNFYLPPYLHLLFHSNAQWEKRSIQVSIKLRNWSNNSKYSFYTITIKVFRLQLFSLLLSMEQLYYLYFLTFKNFCKCSNLKLPNDQPTTFQLNALSIRWNLTGQLRAHLSSPTFFW